ADAADAAAPAVATDAAAAAAAAAAAEVSDAELDLDDTIDNAGAPSSATASVRRRPAPGAPGTRRGPR
ncbi:MAG: hypothetical protein ACRES2_05350, partial [Steroidobacteraceae bacterium]